MESLRKMKEGKKSALEHNKNESIIPRIEETNEETI